MKCMINWKDRLRNITDPSGIVFIDKLGQNEVVAIERFIEKELDKSYEQGRQELKDIQDIRN